MTVRRPGDHATRLINHVGDHLDGQITTTPEGTPRNLSARDAIAVLGVQAQVATAAALLDVADAIRSLQPAPSQS
ncbi:hypothetical protein [Streptomyces sp. NPDC047070]|uniref:hypothetical protein n=1 Tax=Streptomyces sp. NPDC047070 TaxID=3154923 RepID=UPI0034531A82